eukprot:GILJ01005642.1.p1 GENE.GILJ01005642.1~~GILJ01005642.1.p1  ORF type:complete len:542 (-),score=96.31 GILJ01005642.1:226-1851(-)
MSSSLEVLFSCYESFDVALAMKSGASTYELPTEIPRFDIIGWLDELEHVEKANQHAASLSLFFFALGQPREQDTPSDVLQRAKINNSRLKDYWALNMFSRYATMHITSACQQYKETQCYPETGQCERDLRLSLDLLYLLVFHNSDDPSFCSSLQVPFAVGDKSLMALLWDAVQNLSDVPLLPAKKILLLLQLCLHNTLGPVPPKSASAAPLSTVPRGQLLDPSPMEQLYRHLLPKLPQCVVVLLRVLLGVCPNMGRGGAAVDLERELVAAARDETFEQRWEKEYQRHKAILVFAVSDILLMTLQHSKRNHHGQFLYLSQLIVDANGILVMLKYINQDIQALFATHSGSNEPPSLLFLSPVSIFELLVASVVALLRLLHQLCKNQPDRIKKFLLQYKAPLILKRLYRVEHEAICRYSLKLLKTQIKYLPRKWRQANMQVISSIYDILPSNELEDWLLTDMHNTEDDADVGLSREETRQINWNYNNANYLCMTRAVESPEIELTPQFMANYLEWLDAEVFFDDFYPDVRSPDEVDVESASTIS